MDLCWNTAAKLVWNVPRSTFTFLVDRVLCKDMPSVRFSLFKRFRSFHRSLSQSVANEVRVLAAIVGNDIRSTTGLNMSKLAIETNEMICSSIPTGEDWRVAFLSRLLDERNDNCTIDGNNTNLQELIDQVCSSTFN